MFLESPVEGCLAVETTFIGYAEERKVCRGGIGHFVFHRLHPVAIDEVVEVFVQA